MSSFRYPIPLWRSVVAITPETLRNAQSTIEAADPGLYNTPAWTRLAWIPEELDALMNEIQTVPHTQRRIQAWTRRYWQVLSRSIKLVPENEVQGALYAAVGKSHDKCNACLSGLDLDGVSLTADVQALSVIELDAGTSMFRARILLGKTYQPVPRPVFWYWTALAALYDTTECDAFAARRRDIPNLDCLVRAANALP